MLQLSPALGEVFNHQLLLLRLTIHWIPYNYFQNYFLFSLHFIGDFHGLLSNILWTGSYITLIDSIELQS